MPNRDSQQQPGYFAPLDRFKRLGHLMVDRGRPIVRRGPHNVGDQPFARVGNLNLVKKLRQLILPLGRERGDGLRIVRQLGEAVR